MDKKTVYLDNSATTMISEEALAAYNEASLTSFGNPSSLHTMGANAEKMQRRAREILLSSLGASGYRAIFTAS